MMRKIGCLLLLFLLMASLISVRAEEQPEFKNFRKTLAWVDEQQPEELHLGTTAFKPSELAEIRAHLPENAVFDFTASFCKAEYTPATEEFSLNGTKSGVTEKELRALLSLMPQLKKLDTSAHGELSNDIMPDIVDANPQIEFSWVIKLPYGHHLVSTYTAWSTLNKAFPPGRFSERSCEILKYAPGLRALDLGHNRVNDISFLKYLPELRLLILADNNVHDLTPISQLKHLQYCELFMNYYSDLSPLSACTELLDLNVAFSSVTSLDGLDGCTKLERLWAPKIQQLDPESIERFREKHPDCELKFNSAGSTGDGWRQHWRYLHYKDLFKTHVWIPFEEAEH